MTGVVEMQRCRKTEKENYGTPCSLSKRWERQFGKEEDTASVQKCWHKERCQDLSGGATNESNLLLYCSVLAFGFIREVALFNIYLSDNTRTSHSLILLYVQYWDILLLPRYNVHCVVVVVVDSVKKERKGREREEWKFCINRWIVSTVLICQEVITTLVHAVIFIS
jgi:hypothetical protein